MQVWHCGTCALQQDLRWFQTIILFKIIQKPSADRYAEMWVILWRITTGLEGKKPDQLPNLGLKRLAIANHESLSVSQRWPHYQENRRSARDAVQNRAATGGRFTNRNGDHGSLGRSPRNWISFDNSFDRYVS